MGGGLMQLVAYGAQDIYLTGNPQITFFKVVYRRHTNFSRESIPQVFDGAADFDKKVTCTISRNGDLVHRMYLEITVTCDTVNRKVGNFIHANAFAFINNVEVEIGGQLVDKHYGEWMNIWAELTNGYDKTLMLRKMLKGQHYYQSNGDVNKAIVHVPLQFWFNRNPGLALPLIALQYHEVKISVEFNSLSKVHAELGDTDSTIKMDRCDLYCDYIYLDTDERRRFAQVSHEYLIEQVQFNGKNSIASSINLENIDLTLNHPVKELLWVVQNEYYDASSTGNGLLKTEANHIFDYRRCMGNATAEGLEEQVEYACLQLNGHDRFKKRRGNYFSTVQRYEHHSGHTGLNVTAQDNSGTNATTYDNSLVYMYSFALDPEEHQPSGTCNFSRIDNAVLQLELASSMDGTCSSVARQIRIYGINYNVLRIMSGMAGLAYSN